MAFETVVEISAAQRTGKTTLMVGECLNKGLLPFSLGGFGYSPEEVYCNFLFDVTGVNCGDNERMLWWLVKARDEAWRHKWFMADEVSQPPLFPARGYKDPIQTKLATALWQWPKRFNHFHTTSNIGNSADIQIRDASQIVLIPTMYFHGDENGMTRNEDYIEYVVAFPNMKVERKMRLNNPAEIQEWFDSFREVI